MPCATKCCGPRLETVDPRQTPLGKGESHSSSWSRGGGRRFPITSFNGLPQHVGPGVEMVQFDSNPHGTSRSSQGFAQGRMELSEPDSHLGHNVVGIAQPRKVGMSTRPGGRDGDVADVGQWHHAHQGRGS